MIETNSEPVTGLYESTAYVLAMEGSAATWMPAQVQPTMTVACQGHFSWKPTDVMIYCC